MPLPAWGGVRAFIAALPGAAKTGEPTRVRPNEPSEIRRYFRGLSKRGPIEAVYEGGCLGFVLHRQLTSLGLEILDERIDRRAEVPSNVAALPRQADQRLSVRYRQLLRRKHTNLTETAVARELVGYLGQTLLLVG